MVNIKRTLRGHHLLCVHGFQGMGYSEVFVEKMTEIVHDIRDEAIDFPIEVKAELDDACSACPHNGVTRCLAGPDSEEQVTSMDRRVLKKLDLQPGEIYLKSELIRHTADKIEPDDLDELCASCSWLSYGVCKKGIADLAKKRTTV